MVNLKQFLKPYSDAGASNSVLAPHSFVDDRVFLTKSNQLGVVLKAEGIDYECLTDQTLESYTRRAAQAWRTFDERYRIYQYVLKQDRAPIEFGRNYPTDAVLRTVSHRNRHLQSKATGLYTLQLVYVLVFEPATLGKSDGRKRAPAAPIPLHGANWRTSQVQLAVAAFAEGANIKFAESGKNSNRGS